jgi:hypothetical protein
VNCPQFNDNRHVEVRTVNTIGMALTDLTFYLSIGG